MKDGGKCLAVIRIRGVSDVSRRIKDALKTLHLTRNCHAVLIDDRPSYLGALNAVRNYVTWGEVSKEGVALLLRKRGRLVGDKKIDEEYAQEVGRESLDDLADAIHKLEIEYCSLPNVKSVFRLHPPKKGFKGKVKKSYVSGGVSGYRGEAINDLIDRMT